MLYKTKGIVLGYLKYGESSIIVNIFTEEFGAQSYIENGVRKAKAKNKIALFQPLTLLEMVVYKKQNSSLNRISELKCYKPYQQIPYDIVKSSISIFLSEVLNVILKNEEDAQPQLFEYLASSLIAFDTAEKDYQNFHLKLLLQLSNYLGFYPENSEEIMEELRPYHSIKLNQTQLEKFNLLISSNINFEEVKLNAEERRLFLQIIIQFYQIHSHSLKEIKSIRILQEVLH